MEIKQRKVRGKGANQQEFQEDLKYIFGSQKKGLKSEYISYSNGRLILPSQNMSYNLLDILKKTFLPMNYPLSVKSEYLTYQIYDSIQALCSYLRSVLCTHALLVAAGVGTTEASAISAAITWITKDGVGMFFSILFASTFSTYFGSYIKEWRLFADVINDIALSIDMITQFFPRSLHIYILSFSAICKTMCGISAGSTKLCITNHLCLQSNEADVNAKEGSQETAICLIGLILGMILSRYTFTNSYLLFIFLTSLHVYCNYYAVRCLQLQSINRTRGYLLYQASSASSSPLLELLTRYAPIFSENKVENETSFLQSYESLCVKSSPISISTINSQDSILLTLQLCSTLFSPICNISIGVSLVEALNSLKISSFPSSSSVIKIWEELQVLSSSLSYCIVPRKSGGYNVLLRNEATPLDQYEAYCRSLFLESKSQQTTKISFIQLFLNTTEEFQNFWRAFTLLLKHEKWNLDQSISMNSGGWFCDWGARNEKKGEEATITTTTTMAAGEDEEEDPTTDRNKSDKNK